MKKRVGYREFLACRDEIQDYLNKGYNISHIHSILFEQKKISFGIKWFYAVLSKFGMKKIKLSQLNIIGKSDANKNMEIKQENIEIIHPIQPSIKRTQIVSQPLPQSSPGKKPTFEIIRLGDEAFENME